MIAELGLYALILAFGLSLVQATLPLKGAASNHAGLMATGQGAASYVGVQYNFKNTGWHAGLEGQFYGVGSAFNAVQLNGGYALFKRNDFKIEGNLLAGVPGTVDGL